MFLSKGDCLTFFAHYFFFDMLRILGGDSFQFVWLSSYEFEGLRLLYSFLFLLSVFFWNPSFCSLNWAWVFHWRDSSALLHVPHHPPLDGLQSLIRIECCVLTYHRPNLAMVFRAHQKGTKKKTTTVRISLKVSILHGRNGGVRGSGSLVHFITAVWMNERRWRMIIIRHQNPQMQSEETVQNTVTCRPSRGVSWVITWCHGNTTWVLFQVANGSPSSFIQSLDSTETECCSVPISMLLKLMVSVSELNISPVYCSI